jgi:phosphoglycolate phosphatase-like HAD superfamily hydrolase
MGMQRLILFDIDGTLLSLRGAGKGSFRRGLEDIYGTAGPIDGWDFGGKTDRLLCHELLGAAGLPAHEIEAGIDRALARYLGYLEAALAVHPVDVHPGIVELLEILAGDPRVTLGILTGNVADGARLKLSAVGLDGYFRLGSYGSDSANRRDLPAVAISRAHALTGTLYAGKEVVIIGDTPHDIDCGKVLANRTIAVATGTFSVETLRGHDPDFVFESLEATEAVLDAIHRVWDGGSPPETALRPEPQARLDLNESYLT